MIRLNDIKVPVDIECDLRALAANKLRVPAEEIASLSVKRRSLDARKKDNILYVLAIDITLREASDEKMFLRKRGRGLKLSLIKDEPYIFPYHSERRGLLSRPVICGMGPAGLFCAYELALAGFAPVVIERGAPVEERIKDVEKFHLSGSLDPDSNVCYGEGGAGTFSDGKLNTSNSDPNKIYSHVLEVFVNFGAPEEILSWYRPHIGTDMLVPILKKMREIIIANGGEIRFHKRLSDIFISSGHIAKIECADTLTGQIDKIFCEAFVCAIGHSAKKTFHMLAESGVDIQSKPFAVGLRVQHPQSFINESQYGKFKDYLAPAEYRLHANARGKSVYSFCMCPGGYVINSSTSSGELTVNGMSYHDRAGKNANSAIVVSVRPEDFLSFKHENDALSGFKFQKRLEKAAFEAGGGRIPIQTLESYFKSFGVKYRKRSRIFSPKPEPAVKGLCSFADLSKILPIDLSLAFCEGMAQFDSKIPGFAAPDVLLAGVESRTSSPVKVLRDETGQSNIKGLFPCGEGAGYAGGIMSAAADGIRIAERVAEKLLRATI